MVRLKKYLAILIVYLIIMLNLSCSKQNKKPVFIGISGQITIEETSIRISNTEVHLYIQTKLLFSMRGWRKFHSTVTNDAGEFKFKVIKAGHYQIRWNPEDNIWPNTFDVKVIGDDKVVDIIHITGLYPKKNKKG